MRIVEPLIQNHWIRVIHLTEQDKLTRRKYRSDFRYVVEYLACQGDGKKFQKFITEDGGNLMHPEEFLDVISALTNDNRYQQMKAQVRKSMERGEKINMCYFAEMMENIGIEKGMARGIARGMNALNTLNKRLMADGRSEELLQSIQDRELQEKLMKEYGIRELD